MTPLQQAAREYLATAPIGEQEPVARVESIMANGRPFISRLPGARLNEGDALYLRPPAQQVAVPEPVNDFDVWFANPYSKVLMKSIEEDYSPKREPLSEEQIYAAISQHEEDPEPLAECLADECWPDIVQWVRVIEAAHGIKAKP